LLETLLDSIYYYLKIFEKDNANALHVYNQFITCHINLERFIPKTNEGTEIQQDISVIFEEQSSKLKEQSNSKKDLRKNVEHSPVEFQNLLLAKYPKFERKLFKRRRSKI